MRVKEKHYDRINKNVTGAGTWYYRYDRPGNENKGTYVYCTAEYIRLTRDNDNFHVLMGRDTLIHAALCYGATGAIASCANVAPRIAADIYDKYMAGDLKGSLDAQFAFAPLRIACSMGTFPAVIKEGLIQQGFPVGKCLAPITDLKPEEKEKLHAILMEMKLV